MNTAVWILMQNELAQLKTHESGARWRRRSGGSTSSESSAVLERSLSSADEQVKEDIQELKQRFRATGKFCFNIIRKEEEK